MDEESIQIARYTKNFINGIIQIEQVPGKFLGKVLLVLNAAKDRAIQAGDIDKLKKIQLARAKLIKYEEEKTKPRPKIYRFDPTPLNTKFRTSAITSTVTTNNNSPRTEKLPYIRRNDWTRYNTDISYPSTKTTPQTPLSLMMRQNRFSYVPTPAQSRHTRSPKKCVSVK